MSTTTIYATYAKSGTSSYNADLITLGAGSGAAKGCLGFDLSVLKNAKVNSLILYMNNTVTSVGDRQYINFGVSASNAWGASTTAAVKVSSTQPDTSSRVRQWDLTDSSALISAIQAISGTAYLHLTDYTGSRVVYEGLNTNGSSAAPRIYVDYTPNASGFSLGSSSVAAGSNISMTITPASSAYSHRAVWSMGGQSSTVNIAAGTTTSSFPVPNNWMSTIPNATSGTASVTLYTLSGSTVIGSASKSFTVTVPASVKPTISSFVAERVNGDVPSSWGVYVQGKSKAKLTVSAAGVYGSTITSYVISGGNYSGNSNPFTTGYLTQTGTVTFTATVTDSRGRTGTATVSITVYAYSKPSFTSTEAWRCDSAGTANNSGTYARAKAVWTYSNVNGKNTCTCTVGYRQGESGSIVGATSLTSGTAVTIGGGNLHAQNQYYAVFTLSDYFNAGISVAVSIPPSLAYALFIHKGGDAVGIGKYNSDANTLKSAWPLTVDGAVNASGDMTGANLTGAGWIWSKGNLFFGGQLQYYDEANGESYTFFNPSTKRIDSEIISSHTWMQAKTDLYFGSSLYGYDFTTNVSKKIADKDGKLYGTDITATGKITASTASLGAAPPEVINSSFWSSIATAKLLRALGIDVCVGTVPSTTTSNTELDVVFASTGGHEMSGFPLVFIMQDSGTPTAFRITNRSATGFHVKANGVYTFGFQYVAIYFGYNTNGV